MPIWSPTSYHSATPWWQQLLTRVHTRPSDLPAPNTWPEAWVLPLQGHTHPELALTGGAYDHQGGFIAASGLITHGRVVLGPTAVPTAHTPPVLPGRSLYLGLCHYHFGHFLTETLSRLWPFSRESLDSFDHVLVLPLGGELQSFALELFDRLGVRDRLLPVHAPMRLQSLTVTTPALVYPDFVHPAVRALSSLLPTEGQADPHPLFVSRTALTPAHHRMVVGERELESVLAHAGFRIFHPQNQTLSEQIRVFQAHHTLVGYAGSALHTLLLVPGGKQVWSYSARQAPALFQHINKALGHQSLHIDARLPKRLPLSHPPIGFRPEIIDVPAVVRKLAQHGLLSPQLEPVMDEIQLIRQHDTAALMRWVLETSRTESLQRCRQLIEDFDPRHGLDYDLLEDGCRRSEVIRQCFGPSRTA